MAVAISGQAIKLHKNKSRPSLACAVVPVAVCFATVGAGQYLVGIEAFGGGLMEGAQRQPKSPNTAMIKIDCSARKKIERHDVGSLVR